MTIDLLQVKNTLDKHLGNGVSHKNGETSYFCPFCNHYKRKLQVNLTSQKWHCWVCESRGLTISSLLRKSNASFESISKVREIYGESSFNNKSWTNSKELVSLPEDYKPLYVPEKTPAYRQALHYATVKRGLSAIDILKYQMGYCDNGPYAGMLIVPSYDENNSLNYYVGRSFYREEMSHKNPPVSKDIVAFENQINWREPIIVVEGVFDAISTKRNAIPLIGKKILGNLRSKILTKGVKKLYLCLDKDAFKDSVREVEYFLNNGIEVYLVQLTGKDPSEVGYSGMINAIHKAKKVDFFDLIQFKMSL